jgi:uncharacterized protein (DUF4415 family)
MRSKSTSRRSPVSRSAKKTDWNRIDALTDDEISTAVATDPDAAPIIRPSWIKKAKLIAPADKELISIRVDKDVLEHFRARPRYQTRINQILRLVMEEEKTGHHR